MKCEVEFLPVGEATKAGDCIVVRYGEEDAFQLMVVDGGIQVTGDELVAHLHKQFGEDVEVEHVVLSHPDNDHASGLRTLLEQVRVRNLWINIPWGFSELSLEYFEPGWTKETLSAAIRDEYSILVEIMDAAVAQGAAIHYALAGEVIGPFTVLSPSVSNYALLLPQFSRTPPAREGALEAADALINQPSGWLNKLYEKAKAVTQRWITDRWAAEELKDGGTTSAHNESSTVLYANLGDKRLLLTGDAGVQALTWAVQFAHEHGLPLQQFTFVQIPHHGSRSNVGPTILNALIGPVVRPTDKPKFSAYVSAPVDDEQHPRLMVLNAFTRRGGEVFSTKGETKVHTGGFALRPGYSSNTGSIPFSDKVEAYD